MNNISFPNLGIELHNVLSGIKISNFEIKFYAICITCGMLLAYFIAKKTADRTGQRGEDYLDFLLIGVIPALLCARLYYVIFSWDYYFAPGLTLGQSLLRVVNIREGGLAIYGGLIGGAIVAILFAKKRKLNILEMLDTIFIGVPLAQAIGRFGNFFNREAFGTYTDSLFAMAIPLSYYENNNTLYGLMQSGVITAEMIENQQNGCILVHPTFLYEAVWNICLFVLLLLMVKHKRYHGQLIALYLFGYGLGRFWVEGLRTDPLMIGQTDLRVSQVLALVLVVASVGYMIFNLIKISKSGDSRLVWVQPRVAKTEKQE